MNRKISGKIILVMNLILGQVLLVAVNTIWGLFDIDRQITFPVHYISFFSLMAEIVLALVSLYLIKEILRLSKIESDAKMTAFSLKKNEELINLMKAQRHDFLNHIQVIYGLAMLKKTDKLSSYIGEIRSDMETEEMLGAMAQSEFAAFLFRKKGAAFEQGVILDLHIFTDLADIGIPSNELVSIIGNLIDNSLFAVKENPDIESRILLTINEEDINYVFSVANTGPEIPDEIRKHIFLQGFTTKGDKGSGLGLYIISNLVEKNIGTIELVKEPGFNVCFEVRIPKKLMRNVI